MMTNGQTMMCRGVRGATTVTEDTAVAILSATRELLFTMIHYNDINPDDVASAYFTTTKDLTAVYPATAARQLGWFDVPLLCGHEIEVPTGLPLCVRILLHWNTTCPPQDITHVYLRGAIILRPDKDSVPPISAEEIALFMNNIEPITK